MPQHSLLKSEPARFLRLKFSPGGEVLFRFLSQPLFPAHQPAIVVGGGRRLQADGFSVIGDGFCKLPKCDAEVGTVAPGAGLLWAERNGLVEIRQRQIVFAFESANRAPIIECCRILGINPQAMVQVSQCFVVAIEHDQDSSACIQGRNKLLVELHGFLNIEVGREEVARFVIDNATIQPRSGCPGAIVTARFKSE